MSWMLLGVLVIACVVLFVIERIGINTALQLEFKGDVKRETRWLAQYGQLVSTMIAVVLIWELDPDSGFKPLHLMAAVGMAGAWTLSLKRFLGRVRPGRENAGKFLGPSLNHANFRESFPSSHSACAAALSAALLLMYPGVIIFWVLAIVCASLRYVLDAHWPSDVVGGFAIGYTIAHWIMWVFGY